MMTREDVVRLGEATMVELRAHPPEQARAYLIRLTSGTSSAPVVIATEYSANAPLEIGGSHGNEIMERTLVCIGSLTGRLANALLLRCSPDERTSTMLLLDGSDLAGDLMPLLEEYAPDSVHGFPSFIARALVYGGSASATIRVVKCTGEIASSDASAEIVSRAPRARQERIYLASEVGGRIGVQCSHCTEDSFHPEPGVLLEIEDQDAEGVGDILVSKTVFRDLRVERYRIGDIGRFEEACPCGAPNKFRLLGRRGIDYVKCAGALVRREEFDKVAALFPHVIDDYFVSVSEENHGGHLRGKIKMLIHSKRGKPTEALAEEIVDAFEQGVFLSATKTMREYVRTGAFSPLAIEYSEGAFTRGHKDVRIVRV